MHVNGGQKTSSQQDSNSLKLGDVGNFVFRCGSISGMENIAQNLF